MNFYNLFNLFKVGIASSNPPIPINARFEPEKTPEPVPIIEFTGFKRKTNTNQLPILPVQPVSRINDTTITDLINKNDENIKELQVRY